MHYLIKWINKRSDYLDLYVNIWASDSEVTSNNRSKDVLKRYPLYLLWPVDNRMLITHGINMIMYIGISFSVLAYKKYYSDLLFFRTLGESQDICYTFPESQYIR